MSPLPFCFMEVPMTYRGRITKQQLYNEYFYEHLERINEAMVSGNRTFEWKEKMIEQLVSLVGYPVKLSRWQNFLANSLMM
jgi:hypothetical protein